MKSMLRACGGAAGFFGCFLAAIFAVPSLAAGNNQLPIIEAIQGTPSEAPSTNEGTNIPQTLDSLVAHFAEDQVDDREEECLANAVYFEARGEPLDGQLAVADVVLNRAASGKYPATICGVVTQPWQFSFVRNGRFPAADRNSDAWQRAVGVANVALQNLARKLPRNVLWYHTDYVSPNWGRRLTREAKIGLHIFYS